MNRCKSSCANLYRSLIVQRILLPRLDIEGMLCEYSICNHRIPQSQIHTYHTVDSELNKDFCGNCRLTNGEGENLRYSCYTPGRKQSTTVGRYQRR